MSSKFLVIGGVVVCLLASCLAPTASAQGVGSIGGTVMDSSGAVLPGATVALSNAQGTLGGNQETVSDARGAYQFLRLVPGTYIVKATMQGFRTVEQRNIIVNADATARADLTLSIGTLEEGVVVSGEAPLLDTTSALKQAVMTQETLQALPNRVDLWSITRAIPSIVTNKIDVGGSEAFSNSNLTLHGGTNDGAYLIDGMDVGQSDGTGSTTTLYPDPFSFQESNYQLGNASGESSRGGLVINVITRTGTNQLHGHVTYNGTNRSLGSDNVPAAVRTQILRSIPAKVLAVNPNLVPNTDIKYLYDTGGWLAGPLVRDKVWFSTSFHHQQVLKYTLGSYNPDGTPVPDDNYLWNHHDKISWQASTASQLSYFYTIQQKDNGHQPNANFFTEGGASNRNHKTPQLHQVKWTSSLRSKMVVDASASLARNEDTFTPPTDYDTKNGTIAGVDLVTNTLLTVLPTFRAQQNRRVVSQVGLSYFTSTHDVKFGYQLNYVSLNPKYTSTSTPPMRAIYRSGVPDSVNTYNLPAEFTLKDREQAFFVQDKWKATRKLTINLGLRFDMNYGWSNAACQEANAFLPAKCYEPLKGFPDWKTPTPRFSAVYDLAGDGRTAIKMSANRYITPVALSIMNNRNNPIAIVSDTRSWTTCASGQASGCDLNGDRLPQINELGPSTGYPAGASNRYAAGYQWPTVNEYSVEVQRQLPGNIVATVGYMHRERRRNLGVRNALVPESAYRAITVTEVNSGRTLTVYNQDLATRGLIDLVWDNEPALDTDFNGVDMSLDKRLSNGWMLTGGVSVGKNVGDIYGASDLNNPNFTFRDGITGNDVPFSFRLSTVYELPYGISASGTYQYQNGAPELNTVSVGNNTIALTQGTTSIAIEPRATTRLPNMQQLDASFRKAFRSGSRVFQPRVDLYNLANSATVTARSNVLGPSYFLVNTIQRGRLIKFGMSVEF